MSEAALRGRLFEFLAAHTTLTLATVNAQGQPAAAALFYAHDAALRLYFLSEERARHAQNLASNPHVAATIQDEGQDWRTIRGLQLAGVAAPAPLSELPRAAAVYGQKYGFVAALLAGSEGPGVLKGPLARARFYVLRPSWLRLIDNSVHFGYKEELQLAAGEGIDHHAT